MLKIQFITRIDWLQDILKGTGVANTKTNQATRWESQEARWILKSSIKIAGGK